MQTSSTSYVPPVPTFAASMSSINSSLQQPTIRVSEELMGERTQILTEFLDSQRCSTDGMEYKEKVRSMLRRGEMRLIVNLNDVRHFNLSYAKGLIFEPMDYLVAFDKALKSIVDSLGEMDLPYLIDFNKVFFHVGLEGAFGEFAVTPRLLSTKYLSKMISIEGIVTSCLLVRPKLVKSVHFVEKKGVFMTREYKDATMSSNHIPTSNAYPTEDGEGNLLSTEYGFCVYRDHQKVILQEMPERAPPGQLPRSIEVILGDDLVDMIKPGDRVRITGVYKALASVVNGQAPNAFKTVLLANAIRPLGRHATGPILSDVDITNIKAVAAREDILALMGRSLAPSICGHLQVKQSLVLQLLGGMEKILDNTRLRGDINILLVGDPSVAKSQLLRAILGIAPLAIATTGRGASGVGLTAAVLSDKETGERRLEAGAMVLADRGIVLIDEFDKMSDMDRVALHEVMEQQTVTIAKAGLHLSLNARCSVLAAANPTWSQYRESASPQENIRLPDSLLSRFDLLFIMLDTMNERSDRRIAQHVTAMHRTEMASDVMTEENPSLNFSAADEESMDVMETPIYQQAHRAYYQDLLEDDLDDEAADIDGLTAEEIEYIRSQKRDILTTTFLQKYLHYAKVTVKPSLTGPAIQTIRRVYGAFRAKKSDDISEKTLPVTPRTLETLIRLATAHAKLRLSSLIEEEDALVAEQLLRYSLYKEVKRTKKSLKKRKTTKVKDSKGNDPSSLPDDEHQSDSDTDIESVKLKQLSVQDAQQGNLYESDHYQEESENDAFAFREDNHVGPRGRSTSVFTSNAPKSTSVGAASMASNETSQSNATAAVHAALLRLRSSSAGSSDLLDLDTLMADLAQHHGSNCFTVNDVEQVLLSMEVENRIMYHEKTIIFV